MIQKGKNGQISGIHIKKLVSGHHTRHWGSGVEEALKVLEGRWKLIILRKAAQKWHLFRWSFSFRRSVACPDRRRSANSRRGLGAITPWFDLDCRETLAI